MPIGSKDKSTSMTGIIMALIGLLSTITATMYVDRQKLEDRVYELEREIKLEVSLKHKIELENLILENRLSQTINTIDIIQAYIDSLPFPVWIKKRIGPFQYEMVIINTAYTRVFNITKVQYQGRSDFDVWPTELAQKFTQLDESVFNSKKVECKEEPVIKQAKPSLDLVCKFPIKLNGKFIGVGGAIPLLPI